MIIKTIIFNILMIMAKPLIGKGLGRLSPLRRMYKQLTKFTMPEDKKIIEVEGFLIRLGTDQKGLDGLTTILSATHQHEPLTTTLFKKILQPGMKVIDVGANIGYFTLLASTLVGQKGKVWAIEPEPNNFKNLVENVQLNQFHSPKASFQNIITIKKAISDHNGTAKLYVSKEESGEHSLLQGRPHIKNTIDVQLTTLDNLLPPPATINLLKTDTEGNEFNILLGAKNLISHSPLIVIISEFWIPGIEASGHTPQQYWELLHELGLSHIYIISEPRKLLFRGSCADAITLCKSSKFSINLVSSKHELSLEA